MTRTKVMGCGKYLSKLFSRLFLPALLGSMSGATLAEPVSNVLTIISVSKPNIQRTSKDEDTSNRIKVELHTHGSGASDISMLLPQGDLLSGVTLGPDALIQRGTGNSLALKSSGEANLFSSRQTGKGNGVLATVSGISNRTIVMQVGTNNFADINQLGARNILNIRQTP